MNSNQAKSCVILLHGLSGGPAEMLELSQRLKGDNINVRTPTLAGHCSKVEELCRIKTWHWIKQLEDLVSSVEAASNIFICGLSFGALLSLYIAQRFPKRISALALLSPPLRFRSLYTEYALQLLTTMPEKLLDLLPSVPKSNRELSLREGAYHRHSIAAAVRLIRIRKTILSATEPIKIPTLHLYALNDHHLDSSSHTLFDHIIEKANFEEQAVSDGEHELTLGPNKELVFNLVQSFFMRHGLGS